jgi:hypothetical protein
MAGGAIVSVGAGLAPVLVSVGFVTQVGNDTVTVGYEGSGKPGPYAIENDLVLLNIHVIRYEQSTSCTASARCLQSFMQKEGVEARNRLVL